MFVRSQLALWVSTAAALALQGCSLLFVDSPPAEHAQLRSFDCTSSVAAPVIDTVVAGFQAVRTAVAVGADEGTYSNYPISRPVDIVIGLGLFSLFTGSAVHGYNKTAQCRNAKQALAERVNGPPSGYVPTPTGYAPAPPGGYAPAPGVYAPAPACSYDTQCKGDRVCDAGRCVAPSVLPPIQPPPAQPGTPTPALPPPAALPVVPAPVVPAQPGAPAPQSSAPAAQPATPARQPSTQPAPGPTL